MNKQRLCKICDQMTIKLSNHITYEHGITYQRYCEQEYNIPANNHVYITPKVVDFIQLYSKANKIDMKDIKKHLETIFAQNQYEASKLIKIFMQYTYAIAQYFNLSLINIDKYLPSMIKLKEHRNNQIVQNKHQQYTEKRRKQYDNNLRSVECKICGSQCNEKNILRHVSVAHKMSKEDYLTTYYNDIPKDMNFKKLHFADVLNMYEELAKSKFDNFRDCYQALYDEVCMYDELSEKLGYKVNAICEGLHLDIKQKWTEERKAAQSKRKTGTKWTPLQRQRILEGKGIIDKNVNNNNNNDKN